ncbi:DNA-directed RNA polymerase subunit beta' [Bienertia sinuspersici]
MEETSLMQEVEQDLLNMEAIDIEDEEDYILSARSTNKWNEFRDRLAKKMFEDVDTTSPLYLHPSDGSNTIIIEKLQGSSNYRAWKRSLEIALAAKRKLGFATGAVTRDKEDSVKQEA